MQHLPTQRPDNVIHQQEAKIAKAQGLVVIVSIMAHGRVVLSMACSLSTAVLVRVLLAMQRCMVSRRCFRAVDSMSDREPTLLAIAEEAKLQSVPGDRFGKAPGTAHHPCAPGPHVDGLACDCLRMRLSTVRLLWGDVSR